MKEIYLKTIALMLFCVMAISGYAQKTVTGTVSDTQGPLPGVTVRIKDVTRATSTDDRGRFSIEVSNGETLTFSMIGYITKEVAIANQNNLTIVLDNDENALQEVVVTSLGIKKESRSLG